MAEAGIAALLLTTEPDIRYFTGFLTRFWESPTRPWFLIIPSSGKPIAVIPSIGEALMARCWVRDIRTWQAPDLSDDGVSLLAETLKEAVGASGSIGSPMGHESYLRMPLHDYARLAQSLAPIYLRDDASIMRCLRQVKTEAEITKVKTACAIADRAFARLSEITRTGTPLDQVCRRFQMLCLEEGADWVPYLACAAGAGGYEDVISPATQRPLEDGDVLMLDTGLVWDGYFCDFDRHVMIGRSDPVVEEGHARLIDAVEAAMGIARPGRTAAELFTTMDRLLIGGTAGLVAGRLGHGLGMQLTEWPSLIPSDDTVLQEGMVLTLEPCLTLRNGRILVHEEDIVIGKNGASYLSTPASRTLPLL